MDRQVNRHTITSDLQKLYLIKDWMSKHFRYPDINSASVEEARKAITLKRIQKKYAIYLENPTYSSNLTDSEIYEIEEIIRIGKVIDLWDIELGERIIDPKAKEIEQFKAFKLKGEQKAFVELFEQATTLTSNKSRKDNKLRLIEILNVLDVLSNNSNI